MVFITIILRAHYLISILHLYTSIEGIRLMSRARRHGPRRSHRPSLILAPARGWMGVEGQGRREPLLCIGLRCVLEAVSPVLVM